MLRLKYQVWQRVESWRVKMDVRRTPLFRQIELLTAFCGKQEASTGTSCAVVLMCSGDVLPSPSVPVLQEGICDYHADQHQPGGRTVITLVWEYVECLFLLRDEI